MSSATMINRTVAARLRKASDEFKAANASSGDRLSALLLGAMADAFELGAKEGASPREMRVEVMTAAVGTIARLIESEARPTCPCGECYAPEAQLATAQFATALAGYMDLGVASIRPKEQTGSALH